MTHPTFEQMIDSMTLEVWHNMRRAVETGRWPDGREVSDEQRELCLQAVIAWERKNHLPEQERTGYLPAHCKSDVAEEQAVTLKPAPGNGKERQGEQP
jgi:uncharacterized protein YeaC (DUF1315 family)